MSSRIAIVVGTGGAGLPALVDNTLALEGFTVMEAVAIPATVDYFDAKAVQRLVDAEAAFRERRMREITRYPNTSRNSRRKRAQWKTETKARGRSR